MPNKSKHKHYRREQRPQTTVPLSSQQAETPKAPDSSTATVSPIRPISRPKTSAPVQSLAAVGASRYPYLTSEIKWIGIFAGIIVVLIIIIAILVPRLIS
jgi:hypothetical protein